jgi:hypothetical protein
MEVIAGRVWVQDCLYQRHTQYHSRHSLTAREYDPSVNQTAESFHMTKVRNNSRQRQCWMTVSKKWCKLDIDSDNLDSYTNKHDNWNLVFANHEEEDKIYPLTLTEKADAQRKDQELKVYFKKNAKNAIKGYGSSSY